MTPPGTQAPPGADGGAGRAEEDRVFARVAWRILPVLVLAYLLNYIDRTNIGVAALTMNRTLGLTATQFGTGAGLLFVGYCLFEVPSNLLLYRVGARRWIARIMVSWGLVGAATVFVRGPWSFNALRFLLGVAEAGFFPGVAFYLTCWFPSRFRARALAWFLVSIPASSLVGGPLSGLLLRLDGVLGVAGWQWLFLLEALPCVALGLFVGWAMPDRVEEARWLSPRERAVVRGALAGDALDAAGRGRVLTGFWAVFADRRVWLLGLIYLGFSVGSYGVQVWLPLILKQALLSDTAVGFLVAVPSLFAVVGMIAWARFVDRHGRRVLNVVLACALAAGGFVLALLAGSLAPSLAGLAMALVGVNAARAVFWAIPPLYLRGAAAAGGLALVSSVGTLGGLVGPLVMGWLRDATGSFTAGLAAMAGFLVAAALLAAVLGMLEPDHGDVRTTERVARP